VYKVKKLEESLFHKKCQRTLEAIKSSYYFAGTFNFNILLCKFNMDTVYLCSMKWANCVRRACVGGPLLLREDSAPPTRANTNRRPRVQCMAWIQLLTFVPVDHGVYLASCPVLSCPVLSCRVGHDLKQNGSGPINVTGVTEETTKYICIACDPPEVWTEFPPNAWDRSGL
jgi:hypothetical protein